MSGTKEILRWKYFVPELERPLTLETSPTDDRSYNREVLTFTEGRAEVKDEFNDDMVQLYQDLYATLREGKPLKITPESVRRQIYIFYKCREVAGWG